jgi:DNA polymerase-3 subunit delta'
MFTPPLGHTSVQQQLADMLAHGRMPHALLMHGPQGIGKGMLARYLAARLICGPAQPEPATEPGPSLFGEDEPPTPTLSAHPLQPDTQSPAWHQLQSGSCPDYYELFPEEGKKSTGIKQVQKLLESLQRTADTARVVVIDTIEDLTTEAANTLLKTLEEPRAGIFFILVSHQLAAVLPTIRSRCRLVRVGVLTPAICREVLASKKVTEAELELAVQLCQGAPGAWLNQPQAQRAALQTLREGGQPPLTTPNLVEVLQQEVATRLHQGVPSWEEAQAYQKWHKLSQQQHTLNLPAQWVAEYALKLRPTARKS